MRVTLTSTEGLDNLLAALDADGRARARAALPTFVPHPRIAEHARDAGLRTRSPPRGGDAGLIAGLLEWFAAHPITTTG